MSFPLDSERDVDVDRAVRKIKSLYGKYAETYGSRVFNLKAFEERYKDALRSKLNLKAFLHAEIMVIEELKKRVEGEKSREPRKPGYSEIADGIIEKNLQKVKKYRSIDFHPDAEIETKHLLGASTDFYDKIWGRAARVLKSLRVKGLEDTLAKLENDFIYYVVPFRGSYSRAVDDYALVLSRKNARDGEKAAVNFIRYGGILLNNCLKAMTDGINALEAPAAGGLDRQSGPDPLPLQELLRCRDILLRLIEDFRLGDIRGY
jgi:hypothetical protein